MKLVERIKFERESRLRSRQFFIEFVHTHLSVHNWRTFRLRSTYTLYLRYSLKEGVTPYRIRRFSAELERQGFRRVELSSGVLRAFKGRLRTDWRVLMATYPTLPPRKHPLKTGLTKAEYLALRKSRKQARLAKLEETREAREALVLEELSKRSLKPAPKVKKRSRYLRNLLKQEIRKA